MAAHEVRRLPVIDGHRLAGMAVRDDVARALPGPQVGDLLRALSTGCPRSSADTPEPRRAETAGRPRHAGPPH